MKALLTATLLTFSAMPAMAEGVHLAHANAGQTFAYDGIMMNVYFTDTDAGSEVVATYTPYVGTYAPAHLRMTLVDGDTVSFGLPTAPAIRYTFARDETGVSVDAERMTLDLASN